MLVFEIAVILLATKLAGDLSVRLRQPSVLGKLFVGIILGPSVLGLVTNIDVLKEFSQIGVILLMFIAGLEIDIRDIKKTGKASFLVGLIGLIVPLGVGYFVGLAIGLVKVEAIFLGLILSATSVSISVQVLRELGKLNTKMGAVILGAAVIDDILVIIFLTVLSSIVSGTASIGIIMLKKVLFFGLAIILIWKVVPWVIKKIAPLRVTEAVISAGLIICFLFAYMAEAFGVAAIIGAYIAGVGISLTQYKHEVFTKVETISYSLFVPIFFTSIGVSIEFIGLKGSVGLILILSLVAVATKLLGATIGAKFSGFSWNNSLGIGSAMVSRGEVALVIAALGIEMGMLTEKLFAVLVIVVLITTVFTPVAMKYFFKRDEQSEA